MSTANYDQIQASDGAGEPARATVLAPRTVGSTTITVNSTTNYPASGFIATTGTLLSTGKLDPTTAQVFYGTASGTTITIVSFAPGYTDKGSSINDVVVLKPTTEWANQISNLALVTHNADGTLKTGIVTPPSWTNPYKFSVYRSGGYTTGSPAKVAYDTKVFDTNSNFDIVTNNRYVAPVAGFYWFNAAAGMIFGGAGNVYYLAIYKNGSEVVRGQQSKSTSAETDLSIVGGLVQLAASDYIEVYHYGSGANATTGPNLNYLHGFLVSQT